GELSPASVYNLPECFERANRLFQHTRLLTRLAPRRPPRIWHATYPLPMTVRGAKQLTTVHDLIPLRLPHTTLDDKEFFFGLVREAVRRSDLVLTVSEHTRKDLLEQFDVAPEKVVVTYQPVPEPAPGVARREAQRLLRTHQLRSGEYLLFVGNIEPKKNLGRLLEAYAGIDTELPLVVVGRKAWLWEQELRKAGPLLEGSARRPPRLRLLDYVSREDLDALYANAALLAFPSLYEGFGLPPLEAMSLGCPVLTSETSSMPELCGEAALYVDPYSVGDLRAKLTRMLESEPLRRQLALKGREQVRRFNMQDYRRRLSQAYLQVL
ncbi:MAG TPA: glycosyltransferase family 1 protein, partial [Aggregicoccus sp.]|nr:glycosyltransferase family 1 protein [Aggregicoccus sp.]